MDKEVAALGLDSEELGMWEKLDAKRGKWIEETPPMKRFAICSLLILFLVTPFIWFADHVNADLPTIAAMLILNTIIFFLIVEPLLSMKSK